MNFILFYTQINIICKSLYRLYECRFVSLALSEHAEACQLVDSYESYERFISFIFHLAFGHLSRRLNILYMILV